jgi:hypothetical protein
MRADHLADSGAAQGERETVSSSRELAPDLRALVDAVLRPAVATMRDGIPYGTAIATRDPMRELCAAARANEVRAETLVLAIKTSWRRLPESYGPSRLDAEVTLAAMITRCIREYYGAGRP